MSIMNIISLLGGLGLFLYGMKVMGDGLEKAAGNKMQKIIETMTKNMFKGVAIGAAVTAIIQSSSATTVMVVGFVNAGIMKLTQAVSIIMGANIGTTVTAQILRLGDLDKHSWYFLMLKPKTLAPLAVAIGVGLILFAKKKKLNNTGQILVGFGMLFIGMSTMEGAVKVLRDLPQFKEAFAAVSNPVVGVLIGAAVTAIIQSSSASVGILQALASTGVVTFAAAVPIILGQNIGTCVTALLSSVGANKNAKKAAVIHLMFNFVGTFIFLFGIYAFQSFVGFSFWDNPVNRGGVADFHTIFNISNTLLLIPFAGILVRISHKVVGYDKKSKSQEFLDERFLSTPSIAVSQSLKEVNRMAEFSKQNVINSFKVILEKDNKKVKNIFQEEDVVDEMESNITRYLVKLTEGSLSKQENNTVSSLFHIITDIERISDHAVNIAEYGEYLEEADLHFSDKAVEEIKVMFDATEEILKLSFSSLANLDGDMAKRVQPCEDVIDLLKETLRLRHMDRVAQQKCDFKAGVIFLDIISNLERISDHCSNVGISVEQIKSNNTLLDPHKYLKQVHQNQSEEYKSIYEDYKQRFKV